MKSRRLSINLGLIIKILILCAIIALGVVVYTTCAGTPFIQKIDKTIPDPAIASFEVSTVTKIYYAQQVYENDDNSVTMLRWYERLDDEWIYHNESYKIPPVLKPRINSR